jgi:diguanylate cyclase (GGDEF)-like protein/PAS domain S-box-containing protein
MVNGKLIFSSFRQMWPRLKAPSGLRLRGRLFVGFAGVGAVLAIAVGHARYTNNIVSEIVQRAIEFRAPATITSTQLAADLNATIAALRGYLLTGNQGAKAERAVAWTQLDATWAKLDSLAGHFVEPENLSGWAEVKKLLGVLRADQDKAEALAFTADALPATKILVDEVGPRADKVFFNITRMIDEEEALSPTPERKQLLKAMADVRGHFAAAIAALRMYLISGDSSDQTKFVLSWERFDYAFAALLSDRQLLTPAQRAAMDAIRSLYDELWSQPERIFTIRDSLEWNKPLHILVADIIPRADRLFQLIDGSMGDDGKRTGGLRADQQAKLNQEIKAAIEGIRRANRLDLLLLVVGLAGAAIVAFLTACSIVTPVRRLTTSMTALANGDTSIGVRGTSRDDEIGALSRAFKVFHAKMVENQELLAKLDATTRRLEAQSAVIDRLGIISETDDRGRITHVNDNFCRISGFASDELIGKNHCVLNSGWHPKSFWQDMYATLAKGEVWQGQVRNQAKDGSYYWVHSANAAFHNAEGKATGYLSLRLDITKSKQQEAELAAQNIKLDAALENMAQGLVMFDAKQRIVVCNDRYAEMYALPPDLTKPGTPLMAFVNHCSSKGIYMDKLPSEYAPESIADLSTVSESVHKLADGRTIAVVRSQLADGGWVSTHEDITHRLRLEDRLAHLALHDGLTDLANRTLLRERLERALESVNPAESVAVLAIDLDHFKEVNDTLGHAVGDSLLKVVAERLKSCVRKSDTVARIGGDEFVVLQISDDPLKDAALLSQRILERLHAPFDIDGHQVKIGGSIGIASSARDGRDPAQLLANADIALYRSKTSGRGTYHFFEQDMSVQYEARRSLERGLQRALVNGEFELHYQPILNLAQDRITTCEALLRWRDPERGLISPAEFIPVAEETGIITSIGDWVLRRACAEARNWPSDVKVAINFSATQFKDRNLPNMIFNALAMSGLDGKRLEIEITEGILLQSSETLLAILDEIQRMGVQLVLDDFGAGYSSLAYLRQFRFDKVKLDRCFVSDLETSNEAAHAIVRAIAQLGSDLGIGTVAEGVETEEQLRQVREGGMSDIQGFLISRPVPAADLAQLLGEGSGNKAKAA